MLDKNDEYMWSINQITDPSLNVTSETSEAVDALGSVIATFNRGKSAEFSGSNSIFDLGLFAAQNGTEKKVGSASSKIVTPAFEEFDNSAETYVLKNTPVGELERVYVLNGDGTLGDALETAATAAAGKFGWDSSTKTLTPPTDATANTDYIVIYDYEAESGVEVVGDAKNFPKAGKFVMEVLGTDTCDPTTQIHAFIEFPNAKLSSDFDISFTTDGSHPSMWAA